MNATSIIEREQELFTLCLDHPAEDWDALLASATDDHQLRARVRRLLDRHADSRSFSGGGTGTLEPDDPVIIGPYRILQRVGEGGMGIVYAAEQREPVRRRVAIKVLRVGHNSREILARFDAERQALSLLSHPNIARILDAGTTADHRPYIVMEFVAGERITAYCSRRNLAIRARLELFIKVCEAVQHAHQRGILHRDLKPSNILVMEEDGGAIPKVIDFGIAKALTNRLTEHTLETRMGSLIGTPDYMSPEQADLSPLDVDTRTDIYSLGAVLYELLTGTTPLRLNEAGTSYSKMQQIIAEQRPRLPSQLVTGAAGRKMRGELDWILLKALEKQRTARYSSASEFAADICHYLDDMPVSAGPPSRLRALKKFVRRHWLATASLATVLLTLLASQFLLVEKNRALQDERDRAALAAVESEQVTQALAEIFNAVDPDRRESEALSVPTLLKQGFDRVARDEKIRPAARARLLAVLGEAFIVQGDFSRAAEAFSAAIALHADPDPASAIRLRVRLSAALQESGEVEEARRQLERAQAMTLEYGLRETDLEITVINALALHHLFTGDLIPAIERLERVLAHYERSLGTRHERTLSTRLNFALAKTRAGETAQAREELETVVREAIAGMGAEHSLVADASLLLGNIFRRSGDATEARRYYTQALDSSIRLHGENSSAALNAKMGLALASRHEPQGLKIMREVYKSASAEFGDQTFLTLAAAANLADFLLDHDHAEEAYGLAAFAFSRFREILGEANATTREVAYILGLAAVRQGQDEVADEAFLLALKDAAVRAKFNEDERLAAERMRPKYRKLLASNPADGSDKDDRQ